MHGVVKGKRKCMQRLTAHARAGHATVHLIAQQGVTKRSHVHPNLMSSPGSETALYQRSRNASL
jgi:hypothetical protein